jgi:protein-S-isoprenylcysteine O-methyltransferase Ste14
MPIKAWISRHPRLTAWAVLAAGMVIILIWSARTVGLLAGQWAALIVATVLLAGLCVWIIGWDREDEDRPQGEEPESSNAHERRPH